MHLEFLLWHVSRLFISPSGWEFIPNYLLSDSSHSQALKVFEGSLHARLA